MKLGNVALDGTKLKANASRHSALSHGHTLRLKQQLQAEVETLLGLAEPADAAQRPEGMDIPQELTRREQRLARIAEAKAKIETSAGQDYEQAQAQFAAKQAERERLKNGGRRPSRPPPTPSAPGVDPKAQVNLTDADSRIMGVKGKGFEQCYNAQLSVDMESRLIVAPGLTLGREPHHADLMQRFGPEPPGPAPQDPLQAMAHRLKTREGRALYALRKSTVEPVIGIIKSVMKFRQFLLRGVNNVSGEWDMVCLAYNVKRMHRMQCT